MQKAWINQWQYHKRYLNLMTVLPEKGSDKKLRRECRQFQTKKGKEKPERNGSNAGLVEIPGDEVLFQKQYYSIGDVATMFKENTSLIRYWENEFPILKPKKNKKGDRFFRPEDVKNLRMIYHLLRERKYTIDGAKEFLRNNKAAG